MTTARHTPIHPLEHYGRHQVAGAPATLGIAIDLDYHRALTISLWSRETVTSFEWVHVLTEPLFGWTLFEGPTSLSFYHSDLAAEYDPEWYDEEAAERHDSDAAGWRRGSISQLEAAFHCGMTIFMPRLYPRDPIIEALANSLDSQGTVVDESFVRAVEDQVRLQQVPR